MKLILILSFIFYSNELFCSKIDILIRRVQVSPYNAQDIFNLAYEFQKMKKYSQAIKVYNSKTLQKSEMRHLASYNKAICFYNAGRRSLAYKQFVKNLNENPPKYIKQATVRVMNSKWPMISYRQSTKIERSTDVKEVMYTFISPYYSSIDYNGQTTKQNAQVKGIYGSFFKGNHFLELIVDSTEISYKDNSLLEDITQKNMAISYSYFSNYKHQFKIGGHYINSSDNLTDEGIAVFSEYNHFYASLLTLRMFAQYTYYKNYSVLPVRVYQFTPSIKQSLSIIDLSADVTLININQSENTSGSQNLISYEMQATFKLESLKPYVSYWSGERKFASDNGGLVIYNSSDKYTEGLKMGVNLQLSKSVFTDISYTKSTFQVLGENDESTSKTLSLSIGFSF
ncbi:MAG: tetratricopeptide repeat protein [Halobacteriovoraceae bacterium]|nr:tetratricopeptide repeat protein [Halobacteriovoraceae bacterium]